MIVLNGVHFVFCRASLLQPCLILLIFFSANISGGFIYTISAGSAPSASLPEATTSKILAIRDKGLRSSDFTNPYEFGLSDRDITSVYSNCDAPVIASLSLDRPRPSIPAWPLKSAFLLLVGTVSDLLSLSAAGGPTGLSARLSFSIFRPASRPHLSSSTLRAVSILSVPLVLLLVLRAAPDRFADGWQRREIVPLVSSHSLARVQSDERSRLIGHAPRTHYCPLPSVPHCATLYCLTPNAELRHYE